MNHIEHCIYSPAVLLVALEKKFRLEVTLSTYDYLVTSKLSRKRLFERVLNVSNERSADLSDSTKSAMAETMKLAAQFAVENELSEADFDVNDFLLRISVLVACHSLTQYQIKRLTNCDKFLSYLECDEFNLLEVSLPETASLHNSMEAAVQACCRELSIDLLGSVDKCLVVY